MCVLDLRLEFDSFNIAQPSANGVCNNDQFIVSGSTTAVPIICGVNTGSQSKFCAQRTNLLFSKNKHSHVTPEKIKKL